MAGIDYAELADDAQEIIEENGRACTFARLGITPADPDKPWRAPTTDSMADDPPISISGVVAVIVPDEREALKGELARRSTAVLYVAHNTFAAVVDPVPDISTFDTVNDGAQTWTIKKAEPIKPGSVVIIYVMYLEG